MNINSPFDYGLNRYSTVGVFPGSIAPINRRFYPTGVSGVGGFFDFLSDDGSGSPALDKAGQTLTDFASALLGRGVVSAKTAVGYVNLGPVSVTVGGVNRQGIKWKRPDGAFVVQLPDGSEVPWLDVAGSARQIDPVSGQLMAAGGAAVIVGLAIAAYFMLKRK